MEAAGKFPYNDFEVPKNRCEMQRGIALVLEVWVLQEPRVVLYDALDQQDIVPQDSAAQADMHW